MELECPYPAGIQHFRPPYCPRVDCPSRAGDGPAFRFRSRGRYRRACDRRIVRRFHCHVCCRSFSVQTFRVDYQLKRPELTAAVFDAFVSKVTQRQTARCQNCTRATVRRRLILLSRHAREFHDAVLKRARARGSLRGRFQLDELETFERDRRLCPVTMPVLIHEESRFVLHVEAVALAARGGLSPRLLVRKKQLEAKVGVRRSGSREAVKRCFEVLAAALGPSTGAVLATDQKPAYSAVLSAVMGGRCAHERHPGRAARTVSNPLWPINHTLAMLRDGLSRLVRRSWGVSKERDWLARHAWIWIAYRNYIRAFTNRKKRTTSALRAGLVSQPISKNKFFEWRVPPLCWTTSEGSQSSGSLCAGDLRGPLP
ncbi:MAG: hypothetical protein JNL28_02765 [Planctomycetes bacterium]|nr:hypothetical protein [Planctomycetota bacterium]